MTINSSAPPHIVAQCRMPSPLGDITLRATERGLAAALFDAQKHHPGDSDAPDAPKHPHLALAAREFSAYFKDAQTRFTVPLDPQGSDFQQSVWKLLLAIQPGRLSTYGQIARELGPLTGSLGSQGARAVGSAVGRNPIAIIVPCHRVVGHDGSLTGYAAGLPRKEALLRHEGVMPKQEALL